MPQISACIGSLEFDLTSMAKLPVSQARAIHALSSAALRMVWYLLRSTGSFRAASARAAASEIGVPLGLAALSCLSAPLAGALAPLPEGAVEDAPGASNSVAPSE